MKQRLGIAAALLPSPELLILDEPTNGLDPAGIQEVRELLGHLAGYGLTVLVSSHLLSEIEAIADDLVMLRDGKVLFSGQTKALLAAQQPTVIASTTNQRDLARLIEIATNTGHQAQIVNESVHIVADATFATSFNRAAFEAGIILSSLVTALPTLEETFFELTSDN
jgi:ABC-2 type transport system ATP-binding protein